MATEQVLMALWNSLWMVIMATVTLAVGLMVLAGVMWLCLWAGRKMLVLLHRVYEEASKPLVETKRVKA